MKEKFIITGGAGLIGSSIISELNQKNIDDILVVDHLGSSEKWKNLSRLKFNDYMEKDAFLEKINSGKLKFNANYIIHEGACSSTTETDASYLIENNFNYTKSICEYALDKNKSFAYASSAATYGLGENGYSEKSDIANLRPLNMYGYSKQIFDEYAKRKGWLKKITGLKYFNVFGFGEAHKGEMRSVVLKGYEQILQTGKIQLFKSYIPEYKDGEQKRDFLCATDAAKITLYLLLGKHFGIYNVGRGIAETWNDLAVALFEAMGLEPKIEYVDMPDYLKPKYQYYTRSEMDKLLETKYNLGFTDLKTAIKDYVNLLKKNK